jgi:hypothetical protein
MRTKGCHVVRHQEAGGSNPLAPTNSIVSNPTCLGHRSDRAIVVEQFCANLQQITCPAAVRNPRVVELCSVHRSRSWKRLVSLKTRIGGWRNRAALVSFLATNPEAGDLIPGTGGVRKGRGALPGGGKSGGARVVYYFHNESIPIFLLAAYGKNEKANLSKAERNAIARLVPVLIQNYSEWGERKR